jgi:hypothetical protein
LIDPKLAEAVFKDPTNSGLNDVTTVAMRLKADYHLVLYHKANEPTSVEVDS